MDNKTLTKIIYFLASVPPNSYLRLMLQLALSSDIPLNQHKELLSFKKDQKDQDLETLIKRENLLAKLIEADGEIGEAEEVMLLELMNQIGLFVTVEMEIKDLLLEILSENVIEEIREALSSGSINNHRLFWED